MEFKYAYDKTFSGHLAKKIKCPSCGQKRYVQFYDFEENKYLPEHFGKCDREDNCGYIQTPWEWLKSKGQDDAAQIQVKRKDPTGPTETKRIKDVDKNIAVATLREYSRNNFALYLNKLFDRSTALALCAKYYIGTAKNNGTIFWQVDRYMRIRTGQKIHYKLDGHRDKSINPPSLRLFTVDQGYEPCFFGEHLIHQAPRNAILALVESEKTAVICSTYYPTWNNRPLIWIASCGIHGFTDAKLNALSELDIVLVPDFSFVARATWGLLPMRKKKSGKDVLKIDIDGDLVEDYEPLSAKLRKKGCHVEFFDPYPEVDDGSDLADFVVQAPAPMFVERPNFDNLLLENQGSSNMLNQPHPTKLDFGVIGRKLHQDEEKPIDLAEKMIFEKYGYGVGRGKFDGLHKDLSGQMKIYKDKNVQKFIEMFDLEVEFKY